MTAFELFLWAVLAVIVGIGACHIIGFIIGVVIGTVQHFIDRRRQKRRMRSALAKMRLNREYGRFATDTPPGNGFGPVLFDVNSVYAARVASNIKEDVKRAFNHDENIRPTS